MKVTDMVKGPVAPELLRTEPGHAGTGKLLSEKSATLGGEQKKLGVFEEYLVNAMGKMNEQQLEVGRLGEQFIVDPESVNIEEVTTAMAKAQMSLSLAQTVIDRVISGWNELSTNR